MVVFLLNKKPDFDRYEFLIGGLTGGFMAYTILLAFYFILKILLKL